MSIIKPEDYDNLRQAGRINGRILAALRDAVHPGMRTRELDEIARQIMQEEGAEPPFLNYTFPGGKVPYPGVINVSVNEELVHGIPGKRVLRKGDVVTLDCGTRYRGVIVDSAITVGVGEITPRQQELIRATAEALDVAIQIAKPGRRVGDMAFAIQSVLHKYKVNIPARFGGHGVGYSLHDDPHVPNMGAPGSGMELVEGMAIAIEPMAMLGKPDTKVLRDEWTVVASDRSICAHTEHTILLTASGAEVMTNLPTLQNA